MSANPNADNQIQGQAVTIEDNQVSPAKALFRGEIIRTALWPFPEVKAE